MQSGPPSPDAARLPSLDGMRGVAAVVVFLNHALNIFYPSLGGFVDRPGFPHAHLSVLRWLHVLPVAWLFNGPFAVSFFFVLSGFVLTRQVSAGSRPPTLQRLLLQRFLRLFPLVCVASTVGWLTLSYSQAGIDAVGALSGASSGDVFDPALAGQATLGALLTQILYGVWHNEAAPRLFDPVLWSIGTEFQGSMLLYVVLCSLRHLRAVAVRYIAAAALLVLFIGPFGLCFVAGMGLAERWAQHGRILPRDGAVAALAGPGLIWACVNPYRVSAWLPCPFDPPGPVRIALETLSACALVTAGIQLRRVRAIFEAPLPRLVGFSSYGLYVIHMPVLYALVAPSVARGAAAVGYDLAVALASSLGLVASIVLGHALISFVDAPMQRQSKQLLARMLA